MLNNYVKIFTATNAANLDFTKNLFQAFLELIQ